MTATQDAETLVEALAMIDRGLGEFSDRSLLPSAEVSDFLLDVRGLLTRAEEPSLQN